MRGIICCSAGGLEGRRGVANTLFDCKSVPSYPLRKNVGESQRQALCDFVGLKYAQELYPLDRDSRGKACPSLGTVGEKALCPLENKGARGEVRRPQRHTPLQEQDPCSPARFHDRQLIQKTRHFLTVGTWQSMGPRNVKFPRRPGIVPSGRVAASMAAQSATPLANGCFSLMVCFCGISLPLALSTAADATAKNRKGRNFMVMDTTLVVSSSVNLQSRITTVDGGPPLSLSRLRERALKSLPLWRKPEIKGGGSQGPAPGPLAPGYVAVQEDPKFQLLVGSRQTTE